MNPFSHTPAAFLYGYVQSHAPGNRQISIGGVTYTVSDTTASGRVFPTFVSTLSSSIAAAGWSASISTEGRVQLSGSSALLGFPDNLGKLLGFEIPPGGFLGTGTAFQSVVPSYACLPLFGATWESVEMTRSVEYEVTRLARTHGYIYGGARVYRWRLIMDRDTLASLRFGWCLRSQIRIQGTATGATGDPTNAISSSNPSGYVDGFPLGIQSVRWLDAIHNIAEVELLVTGGAL